MKSEKDLEARKIMYLLKKLIKLINTIDSIEMYPYGTSKDIMSENNIIDIGLTLLTIHIEHHNLGLWIRENKPIT